MKVNYEKNFLKDIQKLDDKNIATKLKSKLLEFESCDNLSEFANIKKLKGYEVYYRLKIGNYRFGFRYEDDVLSIIRFLHRRDIYRLFP